MIPYDLEQKRVTARMLVPACSKRLLCKPLCYCLLALAAGHVQIALQPGIICPPRRGQRRRCYKVAAITNKVNRTGGEKKYKLKRWPSIDGCWLNYI